MFGLWCHIFGGGKFRFSYIGSVREVLETKGEKWSRRDVKNVILLLLNLEKELH